MFLEFEDFLVTVMFRESSVYTKACYVILLGKLLRTVHHFLVFPLFFFKSIII